MSDTPDEVEPDPASCHHFRHVPLMEPVSYFDLSRHDIGGIPAHLPEIVAGVSAVATAASVVAKAKIEKRADVRKAEIEADTKRLEIDAETRRTQIREAAETRRERLRQQTAQAAANPPPATPPTP